MSSSRPRQSRISIQEMVGPLKNWLKNNKKNPYPTKQQKEVLSSESGMSIMKVSSSTIS